MRLLLWQKYLYKEFLKTLLAILATFYSLYMIIDSANHLGVWRRFNESLPWVDWLLYYFWDFLYRAEVLLPFALLLAALRTFLMLQSRGELVALRCGGIALKSLFKPFLSAAILLAILLYFNGEFGKPVAVRQLKRWHSHKVKALPVEEVILSDGSRLLYQDYDHDAKLFSDLIWLMNADHFFRIRYFDTAAMPPRGYFVEEFKRTASGFMALASVDVERSFPALIKEGEAWHRVAPNPEQASLLQLAGELWSLPSQHSYRGALVTTVLYQRLLMPWLGFLCVAIVLPCCLCDNSRKIPSFLLYGVSLFSLVAFYLLLDAMAVLGRRQLIDPFWAFIPIFCAVGAYAWYLHTKFR